MQDATGRRGRTANRDRSRRRQRTLCIAVTAALATGLSGGVQAFPEFLPLSTLNGNNGFKLDGEALSDRSGVSVSGAGDVNGDGLDDLIIGAYTADANGNDQAGRSYVVFGSTSPFSATLPLSGLNGSNGFKIDGEGTNDRSGVSVSGAGDINGDGLDDLIIGAYRDSPNGIGSGSSFVVFGSTSPFPANFLLSGLDGSNGFKLEGEAASDLSGRSVSAAGDVNGDGVDDLIIGAYEADANGNAVAGRSYVVFGRSSPFPASLPLSGLDGSNGFRLDGEAAFDRSGASVSAAGDVNGDGVDDLVIGAFSADPNGSYSGQSYVVFGRTSPFPASLPLSGINGSNGFRLDGEAAFDRSGVSVSAAGDVNGDGLADLIIGATDVNANGDYSGRSYVVFGRSSGFPATFPLADLDGSNGFKIDGEAGGDFSGFSVSAAGDVNGDGVDDLIIGSYGADPNASNSGRSYVVFGRSSAFPSNVQLADLDGSNGFKLDGEGFFHRSGRSVSGAGDVNGDGVDDVIIGAYRANFNGNGSGRSYVVFGGTAGPGMTPRVGVTPASVDFGAVVVGQASSAQTVTVENTGNSDLTLGALGFSGADSAEFGLSNDSCSGQVIAPAAACTVDLALTPAATGPRAAQLDIPSDASSSPDVLPLAGIGVQPAVDISPSGLDFGNVTVGLASPAQTVTVTNTGTANLSIGALSSSGANAGEFGLSNDSCSGQVIAPAAACTVDLALTPAATGPRAAQLDIPSDAPSSPDALPLAGTGVQPAVGISPSGLDFGNVTVGIASPAQTVTVTNTGTANLSIGALSSSGANAGEFGLSNDSCSGQVIAPAAACTVDLALTPAATGPRAAQLDIPSDAPSNPDALPLAGTGVQPAVDISPSGLDFGNVTVGIASPAQTVTVTNTGTANLSVGALSSSGANAGEFALSNDNCSGQVIAPAAACTVDLALTPAASGSRAAQLDIPSDAPSSPDALPLAGTGVQALLQLDASTVDFGEVAFATENLRTLVVSNGGTADLQILSITDPGTPFAIGGSCTLVPVTLAPGADCEILVEFRTTVQGAFSASFELQSNAPSSPDTVNLSGSSAAVPVPVLNHWGLVLLAGLMALFGGLGRRRVDARP